MNNKWVQLVLSLAVVIVGYLATVNWADYVPSAAGTIVIVLGIVKSALAFIPVKSDSSNTNTGPPPTR